MVLIGIDPGSGHNVGCAIYQPKTKAFYKIVTLSYYESVSFILEHCDRYGKENVVVVMENPNLNPTVFGACESIINAVELHWNKGREKEVESAIRTALAKAQNIGKHKKTSQLMLKDFADAGIKVIEVSPTWRQDASKNIKVGGLTTKDIKHYRLPTKTTQAQFQQLTGYSSKTSEHARDAATLVFGQTVGSLELFVRKWKDVGTKGKKSKVKGWGAWAKNNKGRVK